MYEKLFRNLLFRSDIATRIVYATDSSLFRCMPAGVIFPRCEEDILESVRIAGVNGINVLARGAGTSLAGQALTSGIIIDLSRFNEIVINPDKKTACVKPCAVIDEIDRFSSPFSLCVGPSPASSNRATIGGLLSNNGTGARSIVYGMASDILLSARVLLSTGEIKTFSRNDLDLSNPFDLSVAEVLNSVRNSSRWPATWRSASGLNFKAVDKYNSLLQLFCGAEGSLGIILDAEIALAEKKDKTSIAIFTFDDLISAMKMVEPLLETKPLAIELMDKKLIELAKNSSNFTPAFIDKIPTALLAVEFEGEKTKDYIAMGAEKILLDSKSQLDLWRTRKEGLGILMSSRSKRKPVPFIEDCSVPVRALPEYVQRLDEIIKRNGTESAYYAHASAGCLHIRPMLNLRDEADRKRMKNIMAETVELLIDLRGSLTGEHGDGRSKSPYIERLFGKEITESFKKVKRIFDPNGTFSAAGEAGMRIDLPSKSFKTFLRWPGEFFEEVERCNGEAACKKLDGLMCPSYQASKDERLSTRGRANLLRSWLAGENVEDELKETLSKCLACRGCSFECPSQVDMARLKAEFLNHRGAGIRDIFFSNFDTLSKIGNAFGIPFQGIVKSVIGIHEKIKLTAPVQKRFSDIVPLKYSEDCDAVLFVDTHIEFYEPKIGVALMKIAKILGIKISPLRSGCCGRPAFSRGMLEKARKQAEGINLPGTQPIIVVEPSCFSMMKEDAPMLSKKCEEISKRVISVESFLMRYSDRIVKKRLKNRISILFHSHCHQKALKEEAGKELLKIAGDVEELACGCCGMAGTFGYEKENYNLSLAIAEKTFLPSIRNWSGDYVAISGRSCREMAQRTGKVIKHPIEILLEMMREE